jgi:Zn-dependent hydrolases, including glyoxylases
MNRHEIIDPLSGSITYIIYDESIKCSLTIDANNFELIDKFIVEKNLKLEYIILTHEHYDHLLAVEKLQEKYNAHVIASKKCADGLVSNSEKLFRNYCVYISLKNKLKSDIKFSLDKVVINTQFEDNMTLYWHDNSLELFEVNGHSNGSICIILNHQYLFSGDNLLKNRTLITEFFGSNRDVYITKTFGFFKSLDSNLIVLPGHGECFKLGEKALER